MGEKGRRVSERYRLIERVKGYGTIQDLRLVFDMAPEMDAVIHDISMNGLGFFIPAAGAGAEIDLSTASVLFIRLMYKTDVIIAESRIAWLFASKRGEWTDLKGGLEFLVMSPEHRSMLAAIIEETRNSQSL
jgi:hypothetical protein